jgi:hypothetical protein
MVTNLSTLPTEPTPRHRLDRWSFQTLRWTSILLIITVWTSAALFGLYILAYYASALYEDKMVRWN